MADTNTNNNGASSETTDVVYDEALCEKLQDFQYDGFNYIYDLPPQQNSLFMVDEFYDPYYSTSTDGYDKSSKLPKNIQYRIKKISGYPLPKLTIDSKTFNGPLRWNYVSTGRPEDNKLSIDWIEDAFWSVKRYHMNWMNHWYNRYLDCMVVGQAGKFRNLTFHLFRYKDVNKDSAVPIQKAVPIAKFTFRGLIPETLPDSDFGWGEEVSPTVTITYKYNDLEIYFYPFEDNDKKFIGGIADFIQQKNGTKEPYNTGITGFTNNDDKHKTTYFV